MPAPPTWRAKSIGFGAMDREDVQEDAVKKMFTPEFRNRLDAIVPFAYLPPAVVARVVDKFILQLELQLADRNVHIDLDDEARAWLTERGYDKLYGARPMGRLVQEKIKQPLAEELLFGKLVNGGEVKVRIKDNAPAFEITPGAAQGRPRPRASAKAAQAPDAEVRRAVAAPFLLGSVRRMECADLLTVARSSRVIRHPFGCSPAPRRWFRHPARRPDRRTFDPARLSRHVQTLGADAFEGRGPATPGETKTVDYLIRAVHRRRALQPGGDLVGRQAPMDPGRPAAEVRHRRHPAARASHAGKRRHAADPGRADRGPLADSTAQKRVALDDAPLVFVGYGVTAPERDWDDFKDVDVRGKIIVVLVNDPDFEGGEGDFGGKAMTYYGRWTYKYEEAARRGAAGVLIVHETDPASYGWATVKNSATPTPCSTSSAQNPAAEHPRSKAGSSATSRPQLFRAAGLDFEAAKARRQAPRLPAGRRSRPRSTRTCQRQDRGHHLEQCRRASCRARRGPTKR